MDKKRVILSDSSLNRYGYRVLTSGLDIEAFIKNPIMLWAHFRDEGSPIWGNYLPIGHWEDIQINGDELSAIPVFDDACELSRIIHAKYDAGTISAASIGICILATSSEAEFLLPGQTRETVTKAEVREASFCDIPANANAVRLYDRSTSAILAAGMDTQVVPEIQNNNSMKLKDTWSALLAFLSIDKANVATAELSAENVDKIDAELSRLKDENETLKTEKQSLEQKISEKETECGNLKTESTNKDTEITTLKEQNSQKDGEISTLKTQVQNLKNNPAGDDGKVTPPSDPAEDETDDLATFSEKHYGDHHAIAEAIIKQGLF